MFIIPALHYRNLLLRQPVELVHQLINRRIRRLNLPLKQCLVVIELGVLQFPRRNRTISSQSSLRPYGQKTAIVQPAKNSDEFFSKSISGFQVRDGFQHLRDEPGGGIVGAAGLLLGLGALRGIDAVCLMGETSGYLVDPRSATSVLSVICSLLNVTVDPTQLNDRAAEMERMIEGLIEGEKIQSNDELSYIG